MISASKKVLIVSPHFPPVNGADMHRVRISLPFFREFGWEPIVLTVRADAVDIVQDPLLQQTVPLGVALQSVTALPIAWTRLAGVGSVGLRALPFLYAAGTRLIRAHGIDLVYFSTTQFVLMALGRVWKRQLGVPFVVDMQDLWVSDYNKQRSRLAGGSKQVIMHRLHRWLEPWTMRETDGVIAVSAGYLETLRARYPWLAERPGEALPFGAAGGDFDVLRANPRPNALFRRGDGMIHGVYVGRGGADMAPALRILFGALARGLRERPGLFEKVRLHFVGTSYTSRDARKTVEPVADEVGVAAHVTEYTGRVPYFDALQLLIDADFLFVPGSDDPMYSPSKIYPYILARRPLLGTFIADSPAVHVIRTTRAGHVVEFEAGDRPDVAIAALAQQWVDLLERLAEVPDLDREAFAPFTAREMTRRQCALFDRVVAEGARARGSEPVPTGAVA